MLSIDDSAPGESTRTVELSGNMSMARPAMALADPRLELLGQVVEDRYEVTESIGRGGMSVVFKARDLRLKKNVALKVLMPHLSADPLSVQRFQQEATAASHLDHPNIVKVYNVGSTQSGLPFMAMDLLQGRSLSALIKEKGRLEYTESLNIFVQLTAALAHAHEKGVIHRDLKPSNVILRHADDQGDAEVAKLVDFGIAKVLSQDGHTQAKLTQTGDVFGSPHYMSPEQCLGGELDERSDVYSMGCLMYETLTGQPPHTGESTLQILHKHISETPARIKTVVPNSDIPAELEAIVFKCLEPKRAERVQSMKTLKNDLTQLYMSREKKAINQAQANLSLLWTKRLKLSGREKILGFTGVVVSLLVLSAVWLTMSFLDLTANSPWLSPTMLDWVGPKPPVNDAENRMALAYAQMELYMKRGRFLIEEGAITPGKLVSTLTKTALALERAGRLEDALRGLKYAEKLTEKHISPYSSNYPNLLYYIGNVHYELKQYGEAKKYLEGALESQEWAVSYQWKGDTESMLADCYNFLGAREQAEDHYQAALDRWKQSVTPRSAITAARYADLIMPYNTQKSFHYAFKLYRIAKERWLEQGEGQGQNVALCDLRISNIFSATGEKQKSFEFLKRANAELAAAVGEDNPMRAAVIMKYADALWNRGEYLDAIKQRIGCWLILYHAPPPRATKSD
ncbi:MAG: protein kinase [Candidatus Obscuribacterales bacterium]|nr:protein kinase [Candidatus Obscuribacterales bacterium]